MSSSTTPRVVRGPGPKRRIARTRYRRAWAFLMRDFQQRCAYSMQHALRAGGYKCMEVDHFDAAQKDDPTQRYENLFLASRHCNGAKGQKPTVEHKRLGLRFLNCCLETDYGVHIFEDPITNRVMGVTPEGRYHVRHCDLNAEHLVEERMYRAKLWQLIDNYYIKLKRGVPFALPPEFEVIKKIAEQMIPRIPPPPV
jgi:hypothetical protein